MIAHQPHAALGMEAAAVEGNNARRFLAAVLQGMQAKGRQGCRVGVAENAEHAAFLAQRVAVKVKFIEGHHCAVGPYWSVPLPHGGRIGVRHRSGCRGPAAGRC